MPVGEAFKGFRAPLRWPWGQGLFGVEPVSERGGERRSEGEPEPGEASTKGGHSHLAVCKSAAAVINDQQEGGQGVPSRSRLSFLL